MSRIALTHPEDLPRGPLHVFGYGSLLWRPGFEFESQEMAKIYGFHRALRVWSFHHRGTEQQPGLVLGLDSGGACLGAMFRVDSAQRLAVARYLWEREMVTAVYVPRLVTAYTRAGARIEALTFVLDRGHRQYAGPLSPELAARHVCSARGVSGANPEYVRETMARLEGLGVQDHGLQSVVRSLDALQGMCADQG